MLWPVCTTVRRHVSSSLLAVLLCSMLCLLSTSATFAKGSSQIRALSIVHGGRYATQWRQSIAPTDVQCRVILRVPCYSPQEMRNAYNLTPVLDAGFAGLGQTIVIIDSFGSPTVEEDLEQF